MELLYFCYLKDSLCFLNLFNYIIYLIFCLFQFFGDLSMAQFVWQNVFEFGICWCYVLDFGLHWAICMVATYTFYFIYIQSVHHLRFSYSANEVFDLLFSDQ